MKNFQMIKMAKKFLDKQGGQPDSGAAANKFAPMQGRFDSRSSTMGAKPKMGGGAMAEAKPPAMRETMPSTMPTAIPQQTHDLCPIHGKPLDVICVTCKERTCSNCALFGSHKGHDVRPEQEVLD